MGYRCTTDLFKIQDYLQGATLVAFDFETAPLPQYRADPKASLDPHRACIVGISLSVEVGSAIYIPLGISMVVMPMQVESSPSCKMRCGRI